MRLLALVTAVVAALVHAAAALAAAPGVATGQATSVGARSAVVTGRVDPRRESTSWHVEYGPTTA